MIVDGAYIVLIPAFVLGVIIFSAGFSAEDGGDDLKAIGAIFMWPIVVYFIGSLFI